MRRAIYFIFLTLLCSLSFANERAAALTAEKESLLQQSQSLSAQITVAIESYNASIPPVNAASNRVNAVISELNNLRTGPREADDLKHREYERANGVYLQSRAKLEEAQAHLDSLRTQKDLVAERISLIDEEITESITAQVKTRELTTEEDFQMNARGTVSSSSISIDSETCAQLSELNERRRNNNNISSAQDEANRKALRELCYLSVKINRENSDVEGFTLTNTARSRINTTGNCEFQGPSREFDFQFLGRTIQEMNLVILDNARNSGRASHDEMFKLMIFIPRRIFPYVEVDYNNEPRTQTVYLPTGEAVEFNALTKEILSGVLTEAPIDPSANRHSRRFPGVEYTGKGISIEAVRRGGYPAYVHGQSFNQYENTTHAKVKHQGRECLVPKDKLWHGAHTEAGLTFKYSSDEDFVTEIANGYCGWNVKLEELF